jgi:iduronate 2-sulfatase
VRRRDFLSAGAGAMGAARSARAAAEGWNVLFLAVDDLRPELGSYGNRRIRTPNLDRLASRSVVFTQAYCQAAVCGASRASLLTGLRPDSTRVWGNRLHFRETIPDAITLPQCFKQTGWHTQSFGKMLHGKMSDEPSWSVPAWPEGGRQAGMQYVDEEKFAAMRREEPDRIWKGEETPTLEWKKQNSWQAPEVPDNALQDGQVADRAVLTLRALRDRRFFLAVGFQKPHLPFTAPKRYFDLYDPEELPIAEDARRPVDAPDLAFTNSQELRGYKDIPRRGPVSPDKMRALVHGYYAATSYMDAQAGRVLDELDRLGLAERTIVVLFGDHGYHLGEQALWAKSNNFELDTRAPLMLHVPGMRSAGRKCSRLVEFVDIYPTLCEACGIEPPANLEGTSMLPLLERPDRPWKKAAFSQFPRPYPPRDDWTAMGYTMRTPRYRYTEWFDRKKTLLARELYDYEIAPTETVNLANRAERVALREKFSRQLHAGWRAALPVQGD